MSPFWAIKIRIERFAEGKVYLDAGQDFALDPAYDPEAGTATMVGVAYHDLPRDVRSGDVLLLNDGLIVLEVTAIRGTRINTRVIEGGELSDRKGLNRKGGGLSAGALTAKDRDDIRIAAQLAVDYLAVSFPKNALDMHEARTLLRAAGGAGLLVSKIERAEALDNLAEIIKASDAVMVARGDLGVEVGYAELTGLQKRIIGEALDQDRAVITATQMMESMIYHPVPTRAEVSDVANAVMDGTDAVMLSAETAVGKYPVKTVMEMVNIIQGAEKWQVGYARNRQREDGMFERTDEAIARSVMYAANHMPIRCIIALTESGSTTLWMSRIRSDIPIYAFTRHEATRRRVALYRGVQPVAFDVVETEPALLYSVIFHLLLDLGLADEGDRILLTKGELSGVAGGTNSMKILEVRR
jgi:pyruvate kinase